MPRYRSRVRDSSPAPVKEGKAFFALSLFSFDGREGIIATLSPDGEIGRHKRLKISRPQGCAGSIPVPGTFEKLVLPSARKSPLRIAWIPAQ